MQIQLVLDVLMAAKEVNNGSALAAAGFVSPDQVRAFLYRTKRVDLTTSEVANILKANCPAHPSVRSYYQVR